MLRVRLLAATCMYNMHIRLTNSKCLLSMDVAVGSEFSKGSNYAGNDVITARRKAAVAPGNKGKRSITTLPAVDPIIVIASHN
jgi:hypothetical protein